MRKKSFISTVIVDPPKWIVTDSRPGGILLFAGGIVFFSLTNIAIGKQAIDFWNVFFHFPDGIHSPQSVLHRINNLLQGFLTISRYC